MSVLSNIVKVRCMHFWSDWTDIKDIEINVDEFIFLRLTIVVRIAGTL